MRRLQDAGGGAPLHALGGAAALPALAALRDIYGMAEEEGAHWRLTLAPQWLLPTLPDALPVPAEVCDEVPSTQHALRAHAHASPYALFAEHQTAGIGQRGRGWLGLPADALAVSLRLPAPAQPGGLSVALGAMLCAALSPRLRFKWPNDIVTPQGCKVAGILAQINSGALLVGVGANWRMTPQLHKQVVACGNTPAGLAEFAADGDAPSRGACAAVIVRAVVETVAAYADGFAPFRPMAEAVHIAPTGASLQVDGAENTFLGFAEDGALLTKRGRVLSGQTQYVVAGG